jgi:hypothetical protein
MNNYYSSGTNMPKNRDALLWGSEAREKEKAF